ncbi:MAG: hypothetical protein KAQ76_00965 [Elusimicrobiales bacterium]|nr:hypothetical protein [Elusimicrobiales bacterium]
MKKVLMTLALSMGLSLMSDMVFAIDYYWQNDGAHSGSLVANSLNIDAYLPWNSGGSAKAMGMGGAFTAVANDLGGAVEYNPAGLTQLGHFNASVLAIANRSSKINGDGGKSTNWKIIPTYAGAALRIGPLAVALSKKQPELSSTYLKFSTLKRDISAPDGYPMQYDTFSDQLDTSGLDTYVLTAAIKLGKLSVGANYNNISGDIKRVQRGRISAQEASWYTGSNNRFDTTENVNFDGYTMDLGVLVDMGMLRLGAAAKNFKGSVDITRDIVWQDNFAMGDANTWNWIAPTINETLTKFAPTYSVGAALVFGEILTIDMDYVTVNLQDTKKSLGRLGAELWIVPGLFAARGGVKTDFKNLVQDQDQKTMEYFVGAGFKLFGLTVDSSASLAQAKAGSDGSNMTGAVSATLKF